MKPHALTLVFSTLALPAMLRAADGITDEQTNFFERKIRPVLAEKCYECHSAQAKKLKGGLKLDTKEAALRGGDNGPAVVPGKLDESLIIAALKWSDKDMQMPPKKQLPANVIADFEQWIKMGAPDPRTTGTVADADKAASNWKKKEINIEEGRKFWAFQPPKPQTPPQVKNTAWPASDIDRFVLAKIEEKGLQPVADASKLDLLRRLTFDLTGLPPTTDQIQAFVKDRSPDALEKVVDNLLASERFGEHWGRHWLDVARYAESSGKEVNILYPFAWRYRDWVIDAVKKDMPYNEFVKEQIAGDLLPYKDVVDQSKKIVATGFLAVGTKPHNERNPRQFALEVADEQIDTLSQAMLGITVACARCHDHKFDPIPQKDYYSLAGIFLSSETLFGTGTGIQNAHPSDLIDLGKESALPAGFPSISAAERAQISEKAEKNKQEFMDLQRELFAAKKSGDKGAQTFKLLAQRQRQGEISNELARFDEKGNARILTMGVYDRRYPGNSPVYTRGDATQPGQQVPRGFVQVMFQKDPPAITRGSGRRELAEWIGSEENPLTARVFVNRAWRWLMGSGIVNTVDNFGNMGERPSHPELLDHLAVKFMKDGWSIKKLAKDIVMSRTYRLAARHDAKSFTEDPDNTLFWRANKRRLEAEQLRDAILAVSGKLDLYPQEGSPICRMGEGREGLMRLYSGGLQQVAYTRSVYLPIVRDQLPEALSLFDFADPNLVTGNREETNVPSQGLYLLNNPYVLALSDDFARRVYASSQDGTARITNAYWIAYGRPPTAQEIQATRTFFNNYQLDAANAKSSPKGGRDISMFAWSAFCQALMASAEFRYLN